MGALEERHYDEELENGVKLIGFEHDPECIAIQEAVKLLLKGLSEDFNREGLKKTPLRVAKALLYATKGYGQKVKDIVEGALFHEPSLDDSDGHDVGVEEAVIVRDLDLFSYCESCLLPFQVRCHIAYVPSGKRVLGLSKFSRVADIFAKRLQSPKRLADDICSALYHGIKVAGVAVVLECLHLQIPTLESAFLEPNSQGWAKTVISSGAGIFESENAEAWDDFSVHLRFCGININSINPKDSIEQCWCPVRSSLSKIPHMLESAETELDTAVSSILKSLGEDPSRKELVGTPRCYLKWLMNFQNTNLDMVLRGFPSCSLDLLQPNEDIITHKKKQIQTELNLPFWSLCEHHLLPFHGVVHIGYLAAQGISPIGKSLLQSIVHFYGFKLQLQERLTKQIAQTVSSLLGGDVMIVVEASHYCMISRGIEKLRSSTVTCKKLGCFKTDLVAKERFLQAIPIPNTKLEG